LKYDVAIIGAGPAGIFAALELVEHSGDLKVLILEKGYPIKFRQCAVAEGRPCLHCKPCHLLSGWGGSGAFSDGKLTLSTKVGGWLTDYIDENLLSELVYYVNNRYMMFDADLSKKSFSQLDVHVIEEIRKKAVLANLKLVPYVVNHLGSEKARIILTKMYDYLKDKVEIRFRSTVKEIVTDNGQVIGVKLENGELINANYVIAAPGRDGANWMKKEAERLGIPLNLSLVDIGVRVEVPAEVMEPITKYLYEPKLEYYTKAFDDRVRTFCVNPYGYVTLEAYEDAVLVNGYSNKDNKSNNTNFALLVSSSFTKPFQSPIEYAKHIARLANMLSGGNAIVQRLGDLRLGRRSTEERIKKSIIEPTLKTAMPGDLSFVIPYRHLVDILEMLEALDKLIPGVYDDHTLLYGVEAKFYTARLVVKNNLESPTIENLYTIGDGVGITRGLIQASISGVLAARDILKRENLM